MAVTAPRPDDDVPRHDVPRDGRSGFTMVEARQVHYLEWGHRSESAVVCLHGGGQTAYMFEELGAAIGGRHHVLAPDLPSHGDSDGLDDVIDPASIAGTLVPLPDARLEVVERAGHLAAGDSPRTTVRAISRFLAERG